MHLTLSDARGAARRLSELVGDAGAVEVVIAPSFPLLQTVGDVLRGTGILLAAQNVHWEDQGAYTGEVSPVQLRDAGCRFILIGHSERRTLFGETDEMVRRKVIAVLRQELRPILCVGETLEQRRAGQTAAVVTAQLEKGLADGSSGPFERLAIAYEPIWAIGTGQVATPSQISDVHGLIRQQLGRILGPDSAEAVRVLYGGSVTSQNMADLAGIKDLDGVLVGGASLKADGFAAIIKSLGKVKH